MLTDEVDIPQQVFSAAHWNDRRDLRSRYGWKVKTPIRWLLTDRELRDTAGHDVKQTLFHGLVQYRINRMDELKIGGISATEVLTMAHDDNAGDANLLDFSARKYDWDARPDPGYSAGLIVQVDAIYHDSFVALPYQWNCQRDQVFRSENVYRKLVRNATIEGIYGGLTFFLALDDLESELECNWITRYSTANHSSWQVARLAFHEEAWKREAVGKKAGYNLGRDISQGWTEQVTPYTFPEHLKVDPRRPLADREHGPVKIHDLAGRFERELEDGGGNA